ncbi:MAG: hypothetical protein V1720_15705 [bacterium]
MRNLLLFLLLTASLITKTHAQQNVTAELSGPYFGQPPGNIPELFSPEILLKEKQAHSTVVFSENGAEAYWCHNGIWFSKIENGKWTVPKMPPFSKDEYSDDAPFISPHGKQLLFASKRPINPSDTSRKENIWVVDILNNGWSEARPLPPIINNAFQHWQMSVDNKGTIYFSHRAVDDDNNIYYSKYINGEYREPEKMSSMINSEADEGNPFISPDGSYIIFSRRQDRKPVDGGLFISYKLKDGLWTEAVSLKKYIDYKYGGNCAFVSRDGNYLFFLDIFEGKYQRYWISADFIEELRPKE